MNAHNPLIVALDYPTLAEAEAATKKLAPAVRFFKIGMELFTAEGPEAVRRLSHVGERVFLDLKFHDIPNTVGAACEAAARLGVTFVNVHATGGEKMLFQAVQSVHKWAETAKATPPKVLAVTVLTSLAETDLPMIGVKGKIKAQVQRLAELAKRCGLDGVVCSPQEIELIRGVEGKEFLIVTPGVRPVWAARGDQKRVMTPREAIEKGADFIVVGRPITQAPDPLEAARKILSEIR